MSVMVSNPGSVNAAAVIYSPAVQSKDTVTSPEVSNTDSTAVKNLSSCPQGKEGIQSVSISLSQVSDQIIRKY